MTTTLEHTATSAQPKGGGLARHQNFATATRRRRRPRVGLLVRRAPAVLRQGSDNFSDQVAVMTATGWMFGFWIGIGAFNGPFRWLLRPRPHP